MTTRTEDILRQLDACWLPRGRLEEAESLLKLNPKDAWASLLRGRPHDAVWLWETLGLGQFPVHPAREAAARATAWVAARAGLHGLASNVMEALESASLGDVYLALGEVYGEAPSYSPLARCALAAQLALEPGASGVLAAEKAVGYSLLSGFNIDSHEAVDTARKSGLIFRLVYESTVDDAVEAWSQWLASTGYL